MKMSKVNLLIVMCVRGKYKMARITTIQNFSGKNIDLEFIRLKLSQMYGYYPVRKLFVHKSYCNYGNLGYVFFGLEGSPPKGSAVYCPDHKTLTLINAWADRIIVMRNIHIKGLDNLPSTAEV